MANTIQNNTFLDRAYEWGLNNPEKATAIITITAAAFSILAIIAASYIPHSVHLQSTLASMQPLTAPLSNMLGLLALTPFALGILYYIGSKTWDKLLENDTFKRVWTYYGPSQIPTTRVELPTGSITHTQ